MQYALSKIGPFAAAHGVQPDDYLIFFTDDVGKLVRLTATPSLMADYRSLNNGYLTKNLV